MDLNKKQKESLFETLLSYAVKESAMQEIKEMPNEEQIKEKIQLSETFDIKGLQKKYIFTAKRLRYSWQ